VTSGLFQNAHVESLANTMQMPDMAEKGTTSSGKKIKKTAIGGLFL
jgi:hypothetical protein